MTRPSWQDFATHDESAFPELWDGVVGAWAPGLGPTGSRLHDMSRRSNWGTLTNMDNATDWVIDGGQYALDLDGTNDRINVGEITLPAAKTFSLWLRLRAFNSVILSVGRNTSAFGYFCYLESGTIYNRSQNTIFSGSYTGITTNTWSHLVLASDGTNYTVFINGVQRTTMQDAGASILRDVGSYDDNTFPTNAQIDDISVWCRTLRQNEVSRLYLLGRGGMYERRRRTLRRVAIEQVTGNRRRRILTGMV